MPYAATVIADILSANWSAGNTDGITPTFSAIVAHPERELHAEEKDYVLTYNMPASERKFAINYQFAFRTDPVSVDVRIGRAATGPSDDAQAILDHAVKVRDEVRRALYSQRKTPGSGYNEIRYRRRQDLSDRMRRLFRWVIEVDLVEYANALP
ncbi:MAG: hypothetical protein LN413_03840 [Candidatus Thermoplasmatota archaeon]|nr:hypothetical protein [Candidatus Thermoplasmatota archaeon]